MAGDTVHAAPKTPNTRLADTLASNWQRQLDAKEMRRRAGYTSWFRQWLPRYSPQQAFLTILTAAVTADNDADPREGKALDAIVARSRTMRRLSLDQLEDLHERVHKALGLDKWSSEPLPPKVMALIEKKKRKTLEKATRSYFSNSEMRAAILLQSFDIVRADLTILQSETDFYCLLAEMLGMSHDDTIECADLIDRKNEH